MADDKEQVPSGWLSEAAQQSLWGKGHQQHSWLHEAGCWEIGLFTSSLSAILYYFVEVVVWKMDGSLIFWHLLLEKQPWLWRGRQSKAAPSRNAFLTPAFFLLSLSLFLLLSCKAYMRKAKRNTWLGWLMLLLWWWWWCWRINKPLSDK